MKWTNEAEFIAVATEEFFDRPIAHQKHYPDLYSAYYHEDPAGRVKHTLTARGGRSCHSE